MSGDMVSDLDSTCVVTAAEVVSQPNRALAEFRDWALPLALSADGLDEETRDQVVKHVFEAASADELPGWVRQVLERVHDDLV